MDIQDKLPHVGTTIFTVMSAMAQEFGAINLAQGFPDFPCSMKLIDLVKNYLGKGFNQYAPMAGAKVLREQIAKKIARAKGLSIDPEGEITITAGATQALFTAIACFVRPGDEVIVFDPSYDSYAPSVAAVGGKVVALELVPPDFSIDWQAFQAALSPLTRMVVINTPQNPTGRLWPAEDLKKLAELLSGTNILVLSDEVYEHLVFDGKKHHSVLDVPELWERSLAVYSFGKTFHATGWKVGYCVASRHLSHLFRKIHQFNVFAVNHPIQLAIAEFLENPLEYESLPAFFQPKRDLLLHSIKNSGLKPLPSEGTYFQLFDYSEISDLPDTQFCTWLTQKVGVAAIPPSVFYQSKREDKLIRLCFAKEDHTLMAAAERLVMMKALL